MPSTRRSLLQSWRPRLLSGSELDDRQQRLRRLHSRATMALLARLAMHPGRDQPREKLAALLWPEAAAPSGRSRLRQTLSLLWTVLEPPSASLVLQADRRTLRVVPGALWCDVVAMEQAADAGARTEALLRFTTATCCARSTTNGLPRNGGLCKPCSSARLRRPRPLRVGADGAAGAAPGTRRHGGLGAHAHAIAGRALGAAAEATAHSGHPRTA